MAVVDEVAVATPTVARGVDFSAVGPPTLHESAFGQPPNDRPPSSDTDEEPWHRAVWKWPMTFGARVNISMPYGAEILTVRLQGGVPSIWALVDPTTPHIVVRTFRIIGTGHDVPNDATYVSTWLDGHSVWHLFEIGTP